MFKTMLSEMRRQAQAALSEKEDARARWFCEWADLFLSAYDGGKPVVYTSLYAFPMEILYASDVAPFDFELAASMLMTLDIGADLVREAEDRGYSPDICSFHEGAIGSYFRDYFPEPELLISTSFYCGGKHRTSEILSQLFKKPSFFLDVPQEIEPASIRYVEGQLRDAAQRIADLAGGVFDEDRLREAIGHSNRAREAHNKLLNLLTHRPCPWGGNPLVNYSIFSRMFDGSPKLAQIHEGFVGKLRERIEAGKLRPERHRVFWYAWVPAYKNTIFDILAENGVAIPVCETFLIHADEIDPRTPFEGLALKCLKDPFIGRIERRTDILDTVVERYHIDGAILFATPACRQSKTNWALMKQACERHGIPLLVLDVDIGDPRGWSPEQVRTRLEGFIELLDG